MHKEQEGLGTARRVRAELDVQNVVYFKHVGAMHYVGRKRNWAKRLRVVKVNGVQLPG